MAGMLVDQAGTANTEVEVPVALVAVEVPQILTEPVQGAAMAVMVLLVLLVGMLVRETD